MDFTSDNWFHWCCCQDFSPNYLGPAFSTAHFGYWSFDWGTVCIFHSKDLTNMYLFWSLDICKPSLDVANSLVDYYYLHLDNYLLHNKKFALKILSVKKSFSNKLPKILKSYESMKTIQHVVYFNDIQICQATVFSNCLLILLNFKFKKKIGNFCDLLRIPELYQT